MGSSALEAQPTRASQPMDTAGSHRRSVAFCTCTTWGERWHLDIQGAARSDACGTASLLLYESSSRALGLSRSLFAHELLHRRCHIAHARGRVGDRVQRLPPGAANVSAHARQHVGAMSLDASPGTDTDESGLTTSLREERCPTVAKSPPNHLTVPPSENGKLHQRKKKYVVGNLK